MSVDSRYALASRLAQFLRRNGDKVINGSCKLSLTTSALCLLNSLFTEILNPDFHNYIELSNSGVYRVHEDVQYLYDFMKKTSSLKLFHGMQTLRGGVDLSHFSNLTVLELRKIPAHLIIGLSSLSIQLKALICSRSIYLVKELFGSISDEQNTSEVWTELKELNLSYNYLESLDDSIKSLPNVEFLDLSHNNIRSTHEIQFFKRLSFVNLNYNILESLPVFNSFTCRYMNKLYVRNNNLERLDGLECLFNLEEFDVGYNLLSEYWVLGPFNKLKSLKMLNLEGNPLYFHKQHFELVCTILHPFVLNKGFRLNGKFILVPKNLAQNTGNTDVTSHHQTSINTVVGDMQHVQPPEINPHLLKGLSPLVSINSDKSSIDGNSVASSYTSQNDIEESIARGTPQKKPRKKSKNMKSREALISEPEDIDIVIKLPTTNITEDVPSHIKARHVYETRRKEHGKSWLIPDDSFRKLVMSVPKVPSNTPILNNILVDNFPKEFPERLQTCLESHTIETASTPPLENEMNEVLDIDKGKTSDTESERRRHISKESDDIEILASNLQGDANKLMSSEDLSDCEFYDSALKHLTNNIPDDALETESDEESEDSIFFVEKFCDLKKLYEKLLSVQIGAKYIKEKDAISGKVLEKLDLSSLSSVSPITQEDATNGYKIHLEFDTVKMSRQQRFYVFQDLESAERMSKILQPFADAYALKEATVGALECMNCKSQFSKQVANRTILNTNKPFMGQEVMSSSYDTSKSYPHEMDTCPNCGNHILVEMESIPLPSIASPSCLVENQIPVAKNSAENTPEVVSVGSSSSGNLFANLFTSIKISPMLKRKSFAVPFNDSLGEDSVRSVDTVGSNGLEIPNCKTSEPQIRRNSSDVTIISNPSQSSIAVIPEPGLDNNLNTILEKDSQASLSPPISGRSTVLSNNIQFGNPGFENSGNYDEYADCLPPATSDPDFYSLTESVEEKLEKPFKCSDIVSSDSDVYHSPFKSVGSTNINSSENIEMDDSNKLMQILGDKKIMTCDSFLQLDHRLKLHVEINIFRNDEHLTACLQTAIVPLSTGEEFDGVFILSSKTVYIIKFLPLYNQTLEQSESLDKQTQVMYSGSLSHIKQIHTLLGNQGISIACGPASQVYTLIIRDADICNSFCNLILEQIVEKNTQLECLRSATHTILLLKSVLTEENPEILLHQFAFQKDGDIVRPICIILTEENIFLSRILYKKQQSCTDLATLHTYCYADTDRHEVSDVISLKLKPNLVCVEVSFLIESSEVDSVPWTIEMQTKSAMFSFVSSLKAPWEKIFGVPLPLTLVETDS